MNKIYKKGGYKIDDLKHYSLLTSLNLANCKISELKEYPYESKEYPYEPKELIDESNNVKDKSENKMECNICMDNDFNIIFQCGHCCCSECATDLKICHICRAKIVTRIKLHT